MSGSASIIENTWSMASRSSFADSNVALIALGVPGRRLRGRRLDGLDGGRGRGRLGRRGGGRLGRRGGGRRLLGRRCGLLRRGRRLRRRRLLRGRGLLGGRCRLLGRRRLLLGRRERGDGRRGRRGLLRGRGGLLLGRRLLLGLGLGLRLGLLRSRLGPDLQRGDARGERFHLAAQPLHLVQDTHVLQRVPYTTGGGGDLLDDLARAVTRSGCTLGGR